MASSPSRSESRSPPDGERHHAEVSMESFIRHQMTMILQPLSDQVQELDEQMSHLLDGLRRTDMDVASVQRSLDVNISDTTQLRDDLEGSNSNILKAKQALQEAAERDEMLQQGLELGNAFAQRLHVRIEASSGVFSDLERRVAEFDNQVHELRANLQRTSDNVAIDVSASLQHLGSEVQDLKAGELKMSTGLGLLRSDFVQNCDNLKDTRQHLERTCVEASNLQKTFEHMSSREGQLSARLNDWKTQWSKLQPKLEAISKETAHLTQWTDHHKESIATLQHGYATNLGRIETVQNQQVQSTFDIHALQQAIGGSEREQGLADIREGLARANLFANTLQTGIRNNKSEIQRTSSKLDGFETKHSSLCDIFEKTNGSISDLSKEHRKSVASVQSLKLELDKTNDTISTARNKLEATESNLHGLRGEVGRTSDVVQRLDHDVGLCQASFSGLQKGIVETGEIIARRPSTLPKLAKDLAAQDFDLSTRPHSAESTASRASSRGRSSYNMYYGAAPMPLMRKANPAVSLHDPPDI